MIKSNFLIRMFIWTYIIEIKENKVGLIGELANNNFLFDQIFNIVEFQMQLPKYPNTKSSTKNKKKSLIKNNKRGECKRS